MAPKPPFGLFKCKGAYLSKDFVAQLRLEVPEPSRAVAVRLQCSRGSKNSPAPLLPRTRHQAFQGAEAGGVGSAGGAWASDLGSQRSSGTALAWHWPGTGPAWG
jgi:hypothetical protein